MASHAVPLLQEELEQGALIQVGLEQLAQEAVAALHTLRDDLDGAKVKLEFLSIIHLRKMG